MLSAKRPREHGENDLPEFRLAEQAIKGPSSIWKLYYQGSVGGQALTGLPVTKRLAEKRAAKFWPFETGWKPLTPADLSEVECVFAENLSEHAGRQTSGRRDQGPSASAHRLRTLQCAG